MNLGKEWRGYVNGRLVRASANTSMVRQADCKKVKAMHTKMTNGIDALESHRFSEARAHFSDALTLDPSNDRFVATMLSYRALSYQRVRACVRACVCISPWDPLATKHDVRHATSNRLHHD